jgi:hypothetical protein
MGRPKPKYFATTELVLELGLTFYMFAKLQKLGVIRSPDAYQGADRPLWLSETVKDIKAAIEKYEADVREAEMNFRKAQIDREREAQEARKAELNTYREGLVRAAETL